MLLIEKSTAEDIVFFHYIITVDGGSIGPGINFYRDIIQVQIREIGPVKTTYHFFLHKCKLVKADCINLNIF